MEKILNNYLPKDIIIHIISPYLLNKKKYDKVILELKKAINYFEDCSYGHKSFQSYFLIKDVQEWNNYIIHEYKEYLKSKKII